MRACVRACVCACVRGLLPHLLLLDLLHPRTHGHDVQVTSLVDHTPADCREGGVRERERERREDRGWGEGGSECSGLQGNSLLLSEADGKRLQCGTAHWLPVWRWGCLFVYVSC